MKSLRKAKDVVEKLTTRKVIRRPEFPFVSLMKRYIRVRLDITRGCNLRCVMCGTVAAQSFQRREMSIELFDKIAREVFPKAEELTIGCGAEPMLAKNFDYFMRTIKSYAIPQTLIISNGSLLTEQKINSILDAGINQLSISIESANKETYESIRVGAKFERLLENLHLLNELKAKCQTDQPQLVFTMVLMKRNIDGLIPLIRLGKELDMKAFNMVHLMSFAGLDNTREALFHHQELANVRLKEAREFAESQGIRVSCPPPFRIKDNADPCPAEKGVKSPACVQPWTFMIIGCDGDVRLCGWFQGEESAGSFRTQSFRQIWFGEEYTRLREEIRSGNLRQRCVKCAAAWLGDPNKNESFEEIDLRPKR